MSEPIAAAPTLWTRVSSFAVDVFRGYANWLVSITWKRFVVLSLLLIILAAIMQTVPPFSWEIREETAISPDPQPPQIASPPKSGAHKPVSRDPKDDGVVISIDDSGIRIAQKHQSAVGPTASAPTPSTVASSPSSASQPATDHSESVEIALPGATREALREAVKAAREAAREAAQEAREEADEARRDADDARREAQEAVQEAQRDVANAQRTAQRYKRTRIVHAGDSLPELAILFIIASAILKASYKGQIQAEFKAAAATETAESEQLKRQVVEARMAAMQAQVEPHFLFNTLASIDHLIETDPPRASTMQKNLIALLRASMPTMRESHPAAHNLGREMAVIRPYLEILKVRMEDRLQTEIDVPEGLLSADFPSMMVQSLVENAIKHGLEPKPDGGILSVRAEIVHGNLAVTVADTGLGFGKADTAGTGTGLNNIRERLQLLYGTKASVTVADNAPTGTRVTVIVPYQAQPREGQAT
jgi:hypothetical protein